MENLLYEPIDTNLKAPKTTSAFNEPEQETAENPETPDFQPSYPVYYLYKAAKMGLWLLAAGIGVKGAAVSMPLIEAMKLSRDVVAFAIAGAMALVAFGGPLVFLYRFAKNVTAGIEGEDAEMVGLGLKSLYQWIICELASVAIIGLFTNLAFIWPEQTDLFCAKMLVCLSIFMANYLWYANREQSGGQKT